MTGPEVQIGSLDPDEVGRMAELVASLEFFREYGYDRERVEALLRDEVGSGRAELISAKREGRLVGLAWFVPRGGFDRSGYLRLLAVSVGDQRRGVGRSLMQTIEQRHLGPSGITLLVAESNQKARTFYERIGYRQVGSIPDYVHRGRTECIYFKSREVGLPPGPRPSPAARRISSIP